jgi:hypothetical protein
MVSPPASHGPVSVTQVMGEDQPGVRNSARSGGCYANGPGPEESAPDNYSARIHPATKEVIDRHLATINRLLQEGKALQDDVDRFKIFLDVYEILPPRPNTQPQRENWDSLDPMAPLGLPVGKRIPDKITWVTLSDMTTGKNWVPIWSDTKMVIIVISKSDN